MRLTICDAIQTPSTAPVNFAVGDTFTIDTFVPELQKAQNAIVSVDGVQVSRSSNTFNDVIEGVSFTAKKVSSDPQTITVANSNTNVTSKISAFANAYNTLVDTIAKATAYDTKNKTAAPLFGDSGAASIRSTLRDSLTSSVASNTTYTTLSSIGLTFDGSGHLNVDTTKVSEALKKNLDEVQKLFIEAGKSSNSGIQLSKSTDKTKVGSYNINITTTAAQATVSGGRALEGTGLAADETLTIAYNDTAVSVGLTAGQKIDEIVDTLNQTFRDKSMSVQASNDSGKLKLTSINYGSDQTVSVFSSQDAAAAGFHVMVSGHSHRPAVSRRDGVLYLNPGSAGRRRFTLPIAVARLHVRGVAIEAEVIELST
jgi:flagellar hook-associated protein 2